MRILIIKTSALGDIVQAFPVITYLKERFPEAVIDWVVEARGAELVRAHPDLGRVLVIDSRRWVRAPRATRQEWRSSLQEIREKEYEWLFDLQGNVKSAFLVCAARAKKKVGFGWKTVPEWPNALCTQHKVNPPREATLREGYLALVKGFLHDNGLWKGKPLLLKLSVKEERVLEELASDAPLVAPHTHWPNKELSLSQLSRFLQRLDQGPYRFISGRESARGELEQLAATLPGSTLLPPLSLPLLQRVIALSKRVIAMDSLILHLSGMAGTPTIGFFGPSSGRKYNPEGEGHTFIQAPCPYGITFEKRCPYLRTCATGACLKAYEHEE